MEQSPFRLFRHHLSKPRRSCKSILHYWNRKVHLTNVGRGVVGLAAPDGQRCAAQNRPRSRYFGSCCPLTRIACLAREDSGWPAGYPARDREVADGDERRSYCHDLREYAYQGAGSFPERIALAQDEDSVSYRELAAHISKLIQLFEKRGLRAGDGIAQLSKNSIAAATVQLAAFVMGLRYTPLHPLGSREDHSHILADSAAPF